MKVQGWLTQLSLFVEQWLHHCCLIVLVLVIRLAKDLLLKEVLLSVCDWWQSLLHEGLELLNVEQSRYQAVVPTQFEERSCDHAKVLLFNVFPRSCLLANVQVDVDEVGEQTFQLVHEEQIHLDCVARKDVQDRGVRGWVAFGETASDNCNGQKD